MHMYLNKQQADNIRKFAQLCFLDRALKEHTKNQIPIGPLEDVFNTMVESGTDIKEKLKLDFTPNLRDYEFADYKQAHESAILLTGMTYRLNQANPWAKLDMESFTANLESKKMWYLEKLAQEDTDIHMFTEHPYSKQVVVELSLDFLISTLNCLLDKSHFFAKTWFHCARFVEMYVGNEFEFVFKRLYSHVVAPFEPVAPDLTSAQISTLWDDIKLENL